MADISLTASMRSNLLSLQQTQDLMDQTQERLSTGKKVNSAIDNPSSYYTAQSLTNRASDLSSLLDSMGQGIQTIQAANEAIESITSFAEQLKSIANSARDISNNMKTKVSSAKEVDGKTNATSANLYIDTRDDMSKAEFTTTGTSETEKNLTLVVDGTEHKITFTEGNSAAATATNIQAAIEGAGISGIDVATDQGKVTVTGDGKVYIDSREDMSKAELTISAEAAAGEQSFTVIVDGTEHTIKYQGVDDAGDNADAIALAINNAGISGLSATSNGTDTVTVQAGTSVIVDDGNAKITGDVATALDVSEGDGLAEIEALFTGDVKATTDESGKFVVTATDDAQGNQVSVAVTGGAKDVIGNVSGTIDTIVTDEEAIAERNKYVEQYNEVLGQIDALAKDASYKGINLLQENDLKVIFNEDRSSSIEIKGVDASSKGLGLESIEKGGWNLDTAIDDAITQVEGAISELRSMASDFGNNYSIVQTREDFTENLINVLEEGADKLTLADMNEEGANMLALQTRQQLAVNSLSLASQASQAVLQLF